MARILKFSNFVTIIAFQAGLRDELAAELNRLMGCPERQAAYAELMGEGWEPLPEPTTLTLAGAEFLAGHASSTTSITIAR